MSKILTKSVILFCANDELQRPDLRILPKLDTNRNSQSELGLALVKRTVACHLHTMTLWKVIAITVLVFVGLNLFLYGRYKRMMAQIRLLAEEQRADPAAWQERLEQADADRALKSGASAKLSEEDK